MRIDSNKEMVTLIHASNLTWDVVDQACSKIVKKRKIRVRFIASFMAKKSLLQNLH